MAQNCGVSHQNPPVAGMTPKFNPARTVVLLEDSLEQINAVRRFMESHDLMLLAAPDVETVEGLAECGALFFILDIKLGDEPERFKAGLNALEILRVRYDNSVFVAILTAVRNLHTAAIEKLGANVYLDKRADKDEDLRQILLLWEQWVEEQPNRENYLILRGKGESRAEKPVPFVDSDASTLFPSNNLALKIAGATQNDLARMQQERRKIARALGQKPPRLEDLIQEIGARMREELRGALRELAERARYEGKEKLELTSGTRLSGDLVRLALRLLPITYGADAILEQLKEELSYAASRGFSGEWGVAKIVDGQVIAFPLDGSLHV